MKSLVTGGTGFIGSHLVQALVDAGDQVRVLVRSTSGTQRLHELGIECFQDDLVAPQNLSGTVAGMERVFHCAAVATDWGDPGYFQAINVTSTAQLAQAALDANVLKFVHVSSSEVYGHPDHPVTEDAPYCYRGWPYCDTKIDGEKAILASAERGLPTTILRPATVYGPRSFSVVVEFIRLIQSGDMALISGGHKDAGLGYVANLVDALLLAGQPDQGIGRIYNIEDGLGITWRQFVNDLATIADKPPIKRVIPRRLAYFLGWLSEVWAGLRGKQSRPLLTRMGIELVGTHQGFPAARIRRELGWQPRVNYTEAIQRTETWLRAEGYV